MKTNIAAKHAWFVLVVFIIGSSMVALACNMVSVLQTATATSSPTSTVTASSTVTSSPTSTETPTRTPTQTVTPEPTLSIPSGTPMSLWNHLPILPNALAAEGRPADRWYSYVTHTGQDEVLDYYLRQLPRYRWEIDWVSPNDHGGYIIYRKNVLDFIYIFEQDDLTFIEIFLSTGSPSLTY